MTQLGIVTLIIAIILMAYDVYLSNQIKTKKQNLDVTNETLHHAQQDLNNLSQQRQTVYLETQQLQANQQEIRKDITFLNETSAKLRQSLKEQEQQNEKYSIEQKEKIDADMEKYADKLRENAKDELLLAQSEFVAEFRKENKIKLAAAQELQQKLNELRSSVDSATRVIKEETEKEDYNEYHRLQLTPQDIQEINKLESAVIGISPLAESAIHKVIWKIYYEKAFTDLLGRLFINRSSDVCGIYKITNIQNKMCYIGQAVNIGDRWRQHIKRAIGAEERTNNKLYPIMNKVGPWNFTFDIIEECPRDALNKREDYWQDFYHAKDYGYSIK